MSSGPGSRPAATPVDAIRTTVAAEALTAVSNRAGAVHLVLSWGAYAGIAAAGLAVDHLAVWVLCWFAMAWLLIGNGGLLHEAAHNHVFRSTTANRVVGMLAGAMILLPWATYRAFHLEHHIHTADADDPEGEPIVFRSRLQYAALIPLAGTVFSAQLAVFTLRTAFGSPPKWVRTRSQRRLIRINAVVMVAATVLLVGGLLVDPATTLRLWGAPLAVVYVALFPFLLLSEHYGGTGDVPPLENTRTVRSNPFVRFVFWNNNFHAEHHLIPAVPYDKLPRLHQLVAPELSAEWLAPSYTRFHRDVLAPLPMLPRRDR
jgi:fatty acid desaturase